jgi:hypothetical protein
MKNIFFSIGIILLGLFSAVSAYAATITFDPQERVVGTHTPFLIGVDLTSENLVNTFTATIDFPPGVEPVDVSDGNSIISLWIDKPRFDQSTRTLTFSGIIPGGFTGEKGRLVTITAQAHVVGNQYISVDMARSHAYINSEQSNEEPLSAAPLFLNSNNEKENIINAIPDSRPPEEFTPSISQIPNTTGALEWMLLFATQDKGSGIDHYEVREASMLFPWLGQWRVAESPYQLLDQSLESTIYIRAFDKQGNIRSVVIPPLHSNTIYTVFAFGLATLCLILIVIVGIRRILHTL